MSRVMQLIALLMIPLGLSACDTIYMAQAEAVADVEALRFRATAHVDGRIGEHAVHVAKEELHGTETREEIGRYGHAPGREATCRKKLQPRAQRACRRPCLCAAAGRS